MPNEKPNSPNTISWSSSEFEKLVKLVEPHPFLYSVTDTSRKNILAKESTWEQIAKNLGKPVEECKKRWRALRDCYMKTLRAGKLKKNTKSGLFKNMEFLGEVDLKDDQDEDTVEQGEQFTVKDDLDQTIIIDNQEFYEITVVDTPQENKNITYLPKLVPLTTGEPPPKIGRKNCGRKKSTPMPVNLQPIKILPKPANVINRANLVQLVDDTTKIVTQPQTTQLRSEVLDSLIERVLNEHTNSIDVFFRSMAASVKKLPPTLIPKVKMEVCNVIAKYEMQSFNTKNSSS